MAHERLITKLKNQSELTQRTYSGGKKAGGLTTDEDVDGRDRLGSA
jgi:hypothetical protein